MRRQRIPLSPVLLAAVAVFVVIAGQFDRTPASAASTTLSPIKDNTLYEDAAGAYSNGAGSYFFVGRTGTGAIRRGLLAFDIAAAIPAGSTITGVTLNLNMSRTQATAQNIELRRALADWGEGTSNANLQEGTGAIATTGDATWIHRFYSDTFWTNAGSDYSPTVSASTSVAGIGPYSWSSAQMIADVQAWLDDPSMNYGWLLLANETVAQTSKRFDSREHSTPANRPSLVIEYTPPDPATDTPTVPATATPTATETPVGTPTPTPVVPPFSLPLYQPPVLTAASIDVSIQEACVQILPGPCTNMWTYGGSFPGPTIRRPTGQTTQLTFTNNLPASAGEMTVHNHGNHSSPENDGPPAHLLIPTGGSRTYTYDHIENGGAERGAAQFYHDHRMDVTGRNVWYGLTGFYIIDDPADPASLPSGAYDLPLHITDRQFDAQNQIPYTFNPDGVTGDHILINGVYQPYLEVGDRQYRFRILNGSNARVYEFALSTGQPFTQVGTESGLLPAPIARTSMQAGPAERLDVVVDFAGQLGETLYLVDTRTGDSILQFRVTQDLADDSSVPGSLRALPDIGAPTVTRNFNFGRTAGRWTINGQVFDHMRIDAQPVLGTTEKWVLHNDGGAVHTIHLHDVDQQCVSRDGGPCLPYEAMKETWFLGPNETIEIKLKFTDHTGPYIFHCHIIEHEDDGMMAQFEVVPPSPTPTATATPTPSATPTASPTSTDTPTPEATPTDTPAATPSPAPDSDGDGYSDEEETAIGENPLSYCAIMRADLDGDGSVSVLDLSEAAQFFAQTIPPAPGRYNQDGDEAITILDLSQMGSAFLAEVSACD